MDIEQATTEATPGTEYDEVSDADLIAAAQEAGGAASVDVAAEATAAGTPPPAKEAGEAAADPDEPAIAAVIRAREKAFAERQQGHNDAAEMRAQAQQEAEQIRAAARKQAAADYEADLQARRSKFKESPISAIRELGWQTDEMVDAVAREGTAEWKAMRAIQQELAETRAQAGSVDKVKADFAAFKQQIEQERSNGARRAVEQAFMEQHAAPDKTPYLHKRYDPEEIIAKAHKLASDWSAANIPFAHSDVAAYLEHQARARIAGTPAQQVSAVSGTATKVKANGSRTLSPSNGSERRASPKPIDEMNPDEERAALIEAAREARRLGGG
jgi:hypothetical protein